MLPSNYYSIVNLTTLDLLLEIGNGDYPSFDEMITITENVYTVVTTVQDLISTICQDIANNHDKPMD